MADVTVAVTGVSAAFAAGTVTIQTGMTVAITGVSATCSVGSVTVFLSPWGTINDSQSPSWGTIAPSQTPNWTPIG